MGLYKLFSCNVEIQYKSCFLSKATLFTLLITIMTIILPFIVAYKSRGFWLQSHSIYEQPAIHFTYEYLLVAETNDPSQPLVCGEASVLNDENMTGDENCVQIQFQEYDNNDDGKNDVMDFKFQLNVPLDRIITSVIVILALDYQLKTVCPLHMQSLVVVDEIFSAPPTGLIYYGDIHLYQVTHLPCTRNLLDIKYNSSLFNSKRSSNNNIVDFILGNYFQREVITKANTLHKRSQSGHTGIMTLKVQLRIPETYIKYKPSLMQELKWAWPQYLSIVVVFYFVFNKIKKFVFNNRLLMAWEVVPWKKSS